MHFAQTLAHVVVPSPEQSYAPEGLLFTPTTDGELVGPAVSLHWAPVTQYPDPMEAFVRISSRGEVLYHVRLSHFLNYDHYRRVVQNDDLLCLAYMEWTPVRRQVDLALRNLELAVMTAH